MLRLIPISVVLVLACCVNFSAQTPTQSSGGIGPGPEVPGTKRLKVEAKPDPEGPSIKTDGTCTIVLRAIFSKDGKVTQISFVKTAPEKPKGFSEKDIKALTLRAIEAAKKIKFIPAVKDGKPVSMWMQLEYNFSPDALKKKPDPDK